MIKLIIENFDTIFRNKASLDTLENVILDLAVKGKLVPQDKNDELASIFLKDIERKKINKDEIPFEIPKSWEWVRLGEIGITQTGTTPPTANKKYFSNEIPFIKPADISDLGINYNNEYISKIAITEKKARLIEKNSLLMVCIGGSIGKSYYTERVVSCNQQINIITGYKNISSKFIYFFTKTPYFQKELLAVAKGTATPIINKGKWEKLLFPLPPLAEQKRIVAQIEKLKVFISELKIIFDEREKNRKDLKQSILEDVEKCNSDAELLKNLELVFSNFDVVVKSKEDIKDIRNLILSLAIKGKLVPQEGKWRKKKLADCGIWGSGGTPSRSNVSFYENGNIFWLKTGDLNDGIIYETNEKITEEAIKNSSAKLYPKNSIVMAMYGATIGKLGVFGTEMATNQACAVIQVDKKEVFNEFMFYFLKASRQKFINRGQGGAQPNISQTVIKDFDIFLPTLTEQKRIVDKIEILMKVCDELEKRVVENEKVGEILLRSVLEKK